MPEGKSRTRQYPDAWESQPGVVPGGHVGLSGSVFLQLNTAGENRSNFSFTNVKIFPCSAKKTADRIAAAAVLGAEPLCQKLFLSGAWAMVMKSFTRLSRLASELPPS